MALSPEQQRKLNAGRTYVPGDAGMVVQTVRTNDAFDPFAAPVDQAAYGKAQTGVVNQAEQAVELSKLRGQEQYTAGVDNTAAGVAGIQGASKDFAQAQAQTRLAQGGITQIGGDANALRAQAQGQAAFGDLLQQQYTGGGDPSAAQAQLQAGTNASLRSNLAMARSSGNPAAAYSAGLANAATTQQAANQAAQLRAQEQQAARGDVLAARQLQAGTTQGAAGVQGSAVGSQLQLGGQTADIGAQKVQAGSTLAGIGTTQQQLAAGQQATGLQSLGLQSQAVGSDQAAAMRRSEAEQAAFEGGRQYVLGVEQQNIENKLARRKNEREATQGNLDTAGKVMSISGQALGGILGGAMSDERSKQRIKKLEAENSMLKKPGSEFDPFAALEAEGVGDYDLPAPSAADAESERQFLADYDDELTGDEKLFRDQRRRDQAARAQQAQTPRDTYAQEYQAARAAMAGGMPGGQPSNVSYAPNEPGGLAKWMPSGYATSDERSKRDVEDMFDPLQPVEYEYRSQEYGPPGRRAGVLAQDLEKSKLGRNLVNRDEKTGMRVVDTPQLTLANTAEIKLLREKIAALEGGGR